MKVVDKRARLCRDFEKIAAILDVLVKGERTGIRRASKMDQQIDRSIIASGREMVRISRELLTGLRLDDSADVSNYVATLSSSRRRMRNQHVPVAGCS